MNGISAKNEREILSIFVKSRTLYLLDMQETSARFLKYKQKQ